MKELHAVEESIKRIVGELSEKEKRQDEVLKLQREVIRDCALAIRHLHTGDLKEAEKTTAIAEKKLKQVSLIDKGLKHNSAQCFQEFVEVRSLLALVQRKAVPSQDELGVDTVAYLNGLADTSGELRRAMQIALGDGKRKDAQYYFDCLSELYDNLMLVKFSSSLVGPLKHKQDVVRSQVEQARSEMLRSS
jgi:translin